MREVASRAIAQIISSRRAPKSTWFATLLYIIVSIWSTWPLAASSGTNLPTGASHSATVPLFNLWTIWWNSDRVLDLLFNYWDAPIFFPGHTTFAFSEPQPATILVAPIIWVTGSRVLAHNVYLFLSLILNGVFARWLLRSAGLSAMLSIVGGAAVIALPIVHWQIEVVQLVPLWGILWTWKAALECGRQPNWRHGAEAGTAVGVAFFLCVHHGLFLMILLAPSVWILVRRWRPRETLYTLLPAIAVSMVLVLPLGLKLHEVSTEYEFKRSAETSARLSASPGDYTASWGEHLLDPGIVLAREQWRLGPGAIRIGLALLGVVYGFRRRKWRRWTMFLVLNALLALALSQGPELAIAGWRPWEILARHVPGISQVRNVFRFAYFVQLSAVLLAVQGLHGLIVCRRCFVRHWAENRAPTADSSTDRTVQQQTTVSRFRAARQKWTAARVWSLNAAVMTLSFLTIFESYPGRLVLAGVPDEKRNESWIELIRQRTPDGHGILCLPLAQGNRVSDFDLTTRWMYYGTFHAIPMVNGYSGFFPDTYFELRDEIGNVFPDAAMINHLRKSRVTFVVVLRSMFPDAASTKTLNESGIELVVSTRGVDVFEIKDAPAKISH